MRLFGISVFLPWSLGWGLGLVMSAVAVVALREWRSYWLCYLIELGVALVAFGLPIRAGARRTGSRHPTTEAMIWIVGFTAAAVVLTNYYLANTALALPGDLNINTTETIRERNEYFSRPHLPPELVFSFSVVALFAGGCGLLSGITARPWQGTTDLWRAAVFGASTGVAVLTALAVGALVVPIAAHVLSMAHEPTMQLLGGVTGFMTGGVLAGSVAGAIIEYSRRSLLVDHV
jgi:hypothetical protein